VLGGVVDRAMSYTSYRTCIDRAMAARHVGKMGGGL
jgi:hypothetical protein